MRPLLRFLARPFRKGDRRAATRYPIFVGARLDLDVVSVTGTARDLGAGGVFFQTSAPLAPGLRGTLVRDGGADPVPVRVSWRRDAGHDGVAGLGLVFEA